MCVCVCVCVRARARACVYDGRSGRLYDRLLCRTHLVLNWAEHSVREQLCLLEMFKLAVRFLIDVFDLGEQLCSRPMGRRSDV